MPTDFLSLFAVINAAQVPYVVVGGLAMLLHGIDRVTGDIDLVIDLAPGKESVIVTLGTTQIRVASVAHLIGMKQQTARPRDLDDVERLLVLQQRGKTP